MWKIHRFSQGSAIEMDQILEKAKDTTPSMPKECQKVIDVCEMCVSSVRPNMKMKESVSHVNQWLYQEIEAYYVTVFICDQKFEGVIIIDMGTAYGEQKIV